MLDLTCWPETTSSYFLVKSCSECIIAYYYSRYQLLLEEMLLHYSYAHFRSGDRRTSSISVALQCPPFPIGPFFCSTMKTRSKSYMLVILGVDESAPDCRCAHEDLAEVAPDRRNSEHESDIRRAERGLIGTVEAVNDLFLDVLERQ